MAMIAQPAGPAYRAPPCNPEAEMALLGAIMLDNRCFDDVADILEAGHFGVALHGRIYGAIEAMVTSGAVASPITLRPHFAGDDDLKAAGGDGWMASVARNAGVADNARYYAEQIRDAALRRDLMGAGAELSDIAQHVDLEVRAEEVGLHAVGRIERIIGGDADSAPEGMAAGTAEAVEMLREARLTGGSSLVVPTGLAELDRACGGLPRSEITTVGARPGMGKTAFGAQVAINAARAGVPVMFFSLEMPRRQIVHRLICAEAGLDSGMARMAAMTEAEVAAYDAAVTRLTGLPLTTDDGAKTVRGLIARASAWARAGRCALAVIDYLGLIRPEDRYAGNRHYEIGEVTRSLKSQLANRLDIPVLLLHQLNREVEKRDNKRPVLADLRDSGSIEEDSGMVLFLYREHYYLTQRDTSKMSADQEADHRAALEASVNKMEVVVAKNRHGPSNRAATLECDLTTSRVGDRQAEMALAEVEF